MTDSKNTIATSRADALARTHFRMGWWTLFAFLTLGFALETFHGLKLDYYLNVANQTRRLMWTLAHAHGALLGLVHVGLAATIRSFGGWPDKSRTLASRSLIGGTVLLPGGFFLGGVFLHAGDPGLGILLVPPGALLLLLTAFLAARAASGVGS